MVTLLDSGRYRVQWRDRNGRKVGPQPPRTFASKPAARRFGLDREAEVRAGTDVDPTLGRMLLRDWVEQWWESRVGESRSLDTDRTTIDTYVLKAVGDGKPLGDLRLEQVDEQVVQAWVKRLERLTRADGRPRLAPATIYRHFTVLSAVLRPAVRAGRIPRDPLGDIRLPALPPADDFYWEPEEIELLRAQMPTAKDLALLELLVGTGMRWGEAVGLHLPRWVPLRRRVSVVESLVERRGFELKPPKNGKRRDLPVHDDLLLEVMAEHLRTSPPAPCGLDHGRGRSCPGLVFHAGGRPLSRHAWPRQVLDPAVKAAEVRRGTVHDLRHTYASWLALDGVSMRVVQQLLGHASIRSTERYSHLSPNTLDDPQLVASLSGRTRRARESQRESGS